MCRALNVGRHVLEGALDGGHDVADPGEVKYVASAAEQAVVGRAAANISLLQDQVRIVAVGCEIFFPAAIQVVDGPHREAALDQHVDHVAADEPRPARDDRDRPAGHAALRDFRRRTLK